MVDTLILPAWVDEASDETAAQLVDGQYKDQLWRPHEDNKPQQMAYVCEADEIFYGGKAGGGKTDLGLGKALTQHKRTTIFRRLYRDLRDIVSRCMEIVGNTDGLNQTSGLWRNLPGDRMIEFGAMQLERDKQHYKGRGRDLMVFDEAPDFSLSQILFVTGWLRTTDPTIKPQVLLCGNPPTTAEGQWIVERYAPWFDEKHPNPARPGELRWYVRIDDVDTEVENGESIEHNGETLYPKSRTFIPASLKDNPYVTDDYVKQLQALPEPLRSQLLYGDFNVTTEDDPWQAIPTAWVQAAQRRWRDTEKPMLALRCIGNDVARGGKDNTVIAKLYGTWFDDLIVKPGSATPDGPTAAKYVKDVTDVEPAPVFVDVIGIGSSAYDSMKLWDIKVFAVNFSAHSDSVDKSKKYGFVNLRAEAYWKLREALDPSSGEDICLPPGREIIADLCSAKYKIVGGKYQIEAKDDIKLRIGRSPDYGDAIALAWFGTLRRKATFA